MRGKFFGYAVATPCPHCRTPRIVADYDDDAAVFPGEIVPPGSCPEAPLEFKGSEAHTQGAEEAKKPCPRCGGSRVFLPDFGKFIWDNRATVVCENHPKAPQRIKQSSGCPKCSVRYSNPFGLAD